MDNRIKFIIEHDNTEYRIWFSKLIPDDYFWTECGSGPIGWGWYEHLSWGWDGESRKIEKAQLVAYVKSKYKNVKEVI